MRESDRELRVRVRGGERGESSSAGWVLGMPLSSKTWDKFHLLPETLNIWQCCHQYTSFVFRYYEVNELYLN